MIWSHIAPTAKQYRDARNIPLKVPEDYLDFAESYADFIVEFEKKNGDLRLCERWPFSRTGRMPDF